MAVLNKDEARTLYDRLADRYDLLLLYFRVLGIERQRHRLVASLNLSPSDHVVDLCCGTGANLRHLVDAVGPAGRITAVDLSEGMLSRARAKAREAGWTNIDFVRADVERYELPGSARAVLSTFGLEMVPGYDEVIARAAARLPSGARVGLMGLKHPDRWPRWLVSAGMVLFRPFGVSRDYEDFRPWLSAQRHLVDVETRSLIFGAAYRCRAMMP